MCFLLIYVLGYNLITAYFFLPAFAFTSTDGADPSSWANCPTNCWRASGVAVKPAMAVARSRPGSAASLAGFAGFFCALALAAGF